MQMYSRLLSPPRLFLCWLRIRCVCFQKTVEYLALGPCHHIIGWLIKFGGGIAKMWCDSVDILMFKYLLSVFWWYIFIRCSMSLHLFESIHARTVPLNTVFLLLIWAACTHWLLPCSDSDGLLCSWPWKYRWYLNMVPMATVNPKDVSVLYGHRNCLHNTALYKLYRARWCWYLSEAAQAKTASKPDLATPRQIL